MADGSNAAVLNVEINASDNASAVLSRVAGNIGSVSSAGVSAAQKMDTLKNSLEAQRKTTREYNNQLFEAKTMLNSKTKAVEEASRAYKASKVAVAENNQVLSKEAKALDGAINLKRMEIDGYKLANKQLDSHTQAYKDNSKAVSWATVELKDLEKQRKGIDTQIKQNAVSLQKEEAAYRRAQTEVKSAARAYESVKDARDNSISKETKLEDTIKSAEAAKKSAAVQTEAAEKVVQSAQKWGNTGKSIKEFGEGVDAVTKPLQVAAVGTLAVGAAAAKAAMTYETAFTGVKKTVDGTPEQLEAVNKEIRQMAKTTPVSAAGLADIAAAGGQLGVSVENIAKFTKNIAALDVATNLKGEEGAKVMAQLMNVTGEGIDNVDRASSAIVALGNNTATTESDIAHMALRMGKFGNTVRMNTAQVLGYSAALASAGIEAQLGGSAIGRIWLDIEEAVVEGGSALKAYAKYAGVSAKEFAKQWNTDSSGAFNGLIKGLSATEKLTIALGELGIDNIQDKQAVQALANNYEMLAKCMELSSTAYSENTALMKEANTAYATKANQVQLAMNAVVEAGMQWGNVLLPEIQSGAEWVGGLADKFAGLDDNTKKAVVSAGKAVVATGLVSKAAASGIKSVGNFAEGISKITKFAPGLVKVASIAGPVALGIAGITTAVVAGKVAYDAWYTSQYRWSEGLSKGNAKVRESLEAYKKISDIQKEVKDLKLIIANPDSSAEQVEGAKQRLEEIKQLLSEEYNLVIKTDNSNLDNTLDKLKKLSKNELQDNINSQKGKLTDLLPKIEGYNTQKKALENQLELARDAAARYGDFRLEVANLDKTSGDYGKTVLDLAEKYGILSKAERKSTDPMTAISNANLKYLAALNKIDSLSGKLTSLTSAKEEVSAITEELANWETEMIKIAAQSGDMAGVQQALKDMKKFIDIGELDMEGYAQAAALAMNGIDSLEDAWSRAANGDGQALNGVVNDYIRSMQAFGASAKETAMGAVLIQNGFRTIEEAVKAGKLDVVIEQANELAHAMGMIPENAHIKISADGDISLVYDIADKIKLLDGRICEITLDADGTPAIAVIDGVEYAVSNYDEKTHTCVLTAEDGASITIDLVTGKISDVPFKHETSITAIDNTSFGVESAKAQLNDVKDKTVTITVKTVLGSTPGAAAGNMWWGGKKAKGTQNFEGGFAMVNDQKGIPDPRELIVDKGRAFIPQGRDVILPLSKGAKVYTAAQTKAIMSGLGIPHYASGKDNSDAFINARDDWTHYTKTHAVTNIEELEKWNKLLKEVAQSAKDVADAEEMIYAAQLKVNTELDKASEKYIKNRTFNNDWEEYGDNPTAAFERFKERQNNIAAASEQTWEEAGEKIHDFGEKLFDGRIDQSLKWLEHERKYNDMSTEDYIAGLQRIQDYTKAYYAEGIIDLEKCRASMTDIDEKYFDSVKELQEETRAANEERYSAWEKSMNNWVKIHNTYDDWDEIGDSLSQVYARSIKRQEEMLAEGVIDWQTAQDKKLEYSLEMYSAASTEYDEILRKQSEKISKMREKFSAEENALRASWDVSDRAADLDEVNKLLGIYKNAVTDAGQQKYKDLLKQKEQLDRDEQMYQLQVKNNAVLDEMQSAYELMEENKKAALDKLKLYGREAADCAVDIARISDDTYNLARDIGLEYASMSDVTHSYLSEMCDLLSGIKKVLGNGERNVYQDNRKISIRGSERLGDMYVTNTDIVYALSK